MRSIFLHCCLHVVLATKKCLYDDIVNSGPKQVHVNAYLLQMLAEGSQTPFVAVVILLLIFILNKPFVLFVDRIIGQMHVLIAFVDLLSIGL